MCIFYAIAIFILPINSDSFSSYQPSHLCDECTG